MANFTKTNAKPDNCTLAFTLPIACQICLGKVKQPVVCPNQHVFCHGCMNVWLQRNQKCPACRVTISEENPCRPIIGGVNIQPENEQTFSSRELRRARTEILFKEYENEIERLENEMVACRRDNERLRQQVQDQLETRSCDLNGSRKAPSGGQEAAMLAMLTTKLHEATAQSEKVKTELKKLKQGSSTLAEENENLRRENQRLRLELTGRSPRKFSRYTVATLESKIESYEKEARQLQKALERSDSYIEELQRELAQAKNSQTLCVKDQGMSPASKGVSIRTTRHHDLDQTNDTLGMSLMSPQKPNADGRGQNTCMDESSFRLEMPSPVSPDLVKQCFGDREEESRSCKKRLEFTLNGRRTSGEPIMNKLSKLDTADISDLTIGSPVVDRGRPRATKRDLFAAPSCDSTMDTLDPTMNESDLCLNSDLSDCMKLLDAAEKNVEQRRSSDVFSQSTNGRQSLWR